MENYMPTMTLEYLPSGRLTPHQRQRIKQLSRECFNKVPQQEIDEDFIARSRGYVIARDSKGLIVGKVTVYRRTVKFEGRKVVLGGIGGTCVTSSVRYKGLGSQLVAQGMKKLRDFECDIACLSVNIREFPSGGVYRKFGFRSRRSITYTNVRGEVKDIEDEFFAPVCSHEVYRRLMSTKATFDVGRGYW